MQRPLRHLNCPGRQVLVEQWAGSSSDWSPQSSSPSHCHDSGIHRLFAHCHWWASHWCVARGETSQSVEWNKFLHEVMWNTDMLIFAQTNWRKNTKREPQRKRYILEKLIKAIKLRQLREHNPPHSTGSSSEPSWQSWLLLHRKCGLVQFPSLHWNWPSLQWRAGQVEGSSEPSLQSLWPSHFHQIGIHLLVRRWGRKFSVYLPELYIMFPWLPLSIKNSIHPLT